MPIKKISLRLKLAWQSVLDIIHTTRIQLESYHIISRICKIAYTISYNLLTDHTDFFTEFILELRVYLDYLLFFRLQVFTSKRFIVKH